MHANGLALSNKRETWQLICKNISFLLVGWHVHHLNLLSLSHLMEVVIPQVNKISEFGTGRFCKHVHRGPIISFKCERPIVNQCYMRENNFKDCN